MLRVLSTFMTMSREEYIQKKRLESVEVASKMLDGTLDYLEGALLLSELRFAVGLEDRDEDFAAFTGVMSEVDHLPVGPVRIHWSKSALEKHQPDIERATTWAKECTLENCKSIIRRFGT
ncbi:hypothetical protein MED297_08891 [Reinekea sp. MED297]|uniref:Uncharacterized protein n=1 Tax=Reinekea blandensis MED297 TaxID=314283 RepID=A4BGG2_9GAMM|nr:hypothetical protein MED297_08891 [Reinekea sp. MED297] [Reinekea blandensis MED297]